MSWDLKRKDSIRTTRQKRLNIKNSRYFYMMRHEETAATNLHVRFLLFKRSLLSVRRKLAPSVLVRARLLENI